VARTSNRELIARLDRAIRPYAARFRKLVRAAAHAARDETSLVALVEAIESRDVARVMAAVRLDDFAEVLAGVGGGDSVARITRGAMEAAAGVAIVQLPRSASIAMKFDILNPRAVNFVKTYEMKLIREVTDESRKAVQETVIRAFETGLHPRQQARIIRDSIGLTRQQARAITNFRLQLTTQQNYPGDRYMVAADRRRLSATEARQVTRQMASGHMTQPEIDAMVNRYYQSLVNLRSNTIARTETLRASSVGQEELWAQAAEQGLIDPVGSRRFWVTAGDERVRENHRLIPGLNKGGRRIGEMFQTPDGDTPYPPQSVNCRCRLIMRAR